MNVLLFGASGMVGQGVLRECLLDPGVERVVSVGRRASGQQHTKFREIVCRDIADLTPVEDQLRGFDACFWALGASSVGMKEEDYRRITYDLTLGAARTLVRLNPGMTFILVSGAIAQDAPCGLG
jgi:putative NADH-flavin reductase